jgi:Tol biopolymer transport system component
VCSFDICLVTPKGQVQQLTQTTSEPLFLGPIWSPDGRWIASTCLSLGSKQFPTCLVDATDGSVRTVTRAGRFEGWTPDGKLVISSSAGPTNAIALRQLRSMGIMGRTTSRPLPGSRGVEGPDWSPAGRTVLVARSNRLVVVNRDGKVVQTLISLPRGSSPSFPAWQPFSRRS